MRKAVYFSGTVGPHGSGHGAQAVHVSQSLFRAQGSPFKQESALFDFRGQIGDPYLMGEGVGFFTAFFWLVLVLFGGWLGALLYMTGGGVGVCFGLEEGGLVVPGGWVTGWVVGLLGGFVVPGDLVGCGPRFGP